MPDQQVALKPQEKKGFFSKMSLFQKILLFIGVIIILILAVSIVIGGIQSFYQFFFFLIVFSIVAVGIYLVVKAVGMIYQPKYFSPREDYTTKIKNMAIDYCPDNLGNLYFMGDVGKKHVLAGKIKGCLVLPHLVGDIQRYAEEIKSLDGKITHKKGEVVYTDMKTFEGKPVPKFQNVRAISDGDTFFIAEKGWLFFKKTHYIRCHRDLHSTLNGDVSIFDINPQAYGIFEYPFKQYQLNLPQILMQNQIETILATHEHQHDLISQATDAGLYSNPLMRFSMKQQAELGSSGEDA